MTPVEFYTARLDELEALAIAGDCRCRWRELRADCPDFIVADIAAKRAILHLADQQFQPHAVMDGMGWEQYENGLTAAYRAVVSHMLQPFSDHPDFEERWKL